MRTLIGPIVRGENHDPFCVPAAISAVTGIPTGEIASCIFKVREKLGVKNSGISRKFWSASDHRYVERKLVGGVRSNETSLCLRDLGIEHDNLGYHEIAELRKKIYKPRKIDSDEIFINGSRWFQYPELSLAAFLDNMPADMKGKRLLISLRSHMIAAQDNFCADSLCHEPRTRKEFGSGRSRVHHVFVLK